ncbi:MAG: hypothetical protein ACREXY_17345, partial [Gammaproteobacteria bacterium]
PFPYSDSRLLPYLQHSFWFLPTVAACEAMAKLLAEKHNTFWHDYEVVVAAGASAGIGLDALPPVRKAIGSGFETKTITLLSFPKIRSGRIRAVRENQTIIQCDGCDHLPAWNIYRRSAQVAAPA